MEIPDMVVPDHQEIVLMWDDRPIGKMFSKNVKPNPDQEIYTTTWQGVCLGEEVKASNYGDAVKRMMMIADRHNIIRTHIEAGYGIDTLYLPPFEE